MKVTVTFGRTGVVVPCKQGWTVRDLIQQATQRYKKLLEQEGDFLVRTHHVEYCDGGILDPDDILSDLVEDKDKLMAVYEELEAQQRSVATVSHAPSPDVYQSELSVFQPIRGGEIEVTSSTLKSNTPLLVRSSSDSALFPTSETELSQTQDTATAASGSQLAVEVTGASKHTDISSLTHTVEICGEHGPLGIHVVPYCSSLSGRSLGLYIRGVEEESRSRKEELFQEDECIVQINQTELIDKTFSQAQEVFRQAMRSPIVQLEVVPSSNRERYEKSLISQLFANNPAPEGSPLISRNREPPPIKVKPAFKRSDSPAMRLVDDDATLETTICASNGRSDNPLLKKGPPLSNLVATKIGGRRLRIDLKKGTDGLGFTVVTRDSSVHGPGPILVKNILPRGAAIHDGRLQSGDRILQVNGVDITGVGQEELVCMLRSTRQGESVSLAVLRQEELFLPREMQSEVSRGAAVAAQDGKEQLVFEVPLNDTGSAGLGVSLKGNKAIETGEDLGIFIKSIIHGGAAYKDGRLCVNDQLVAVNGESLLGRSNHVAMETLRRSMSQEGNLRGTIQLVVLRVVQEQDGASPNRSFDSSYGPSGLVSPASGQTGLVSKANNPSEPPMVTNSCYPSSVTNGSYSHMDEDEEELSRHETDFSTSKQKPYLQHRQTPVTPSPVQLLSGARPQSPGRAQPQRQYQHVKASKSMDLGMTQSQQATVADESNVASLAGIKQAHTPAELGPTLGLKKSSSLESLQTAMSEVSKKNELLPFHRPRPNMVRGRGCNESFRAAIDKSYDGPAEDDDDDDDSDQSSGLDTPTSGSSRLGAGDQPDDKDKKDKKKGKGKKKEKSKAKRKEKEKKKAEEPEETEKKTKRKGFGLLRFGKRKEEKKVAPQRQKSDILTDHELERMREERERIEAKHSELRELQSRDQRGGVPYPTVEDDDADPNYARIHTFRKRDAGASPQTLPQTPPYAPHHVHARTPSPQRPPPAFQAHGNHGNHGGSPNAAPDGDPLDGLYAKVNKPRGAGAVSPPAPPIASDSSVDRIQQLRREYQQARREGIMPAYEELDPRRRGQEIDTHRMQGRGPDHRLAPRYEDVERQYASLPRRGPLDPADYPMQPWLGHYPGGPHTAQGYPQAPSYPNAQPGLSYPGYPSSPQYSRPVDSGYYPHPSSHHQPQPQQRGPMRQDVPPSPTPPLRAPRYETMARGAGAAGGYRHTREASPEQYGYIGERVRHQTQPKPRQKNPMTAAV